MRTRLHLSALLTEEPSAGHPGNPPRRFPTHESCHPLIDAWGSGNRSMGGYYASPEPISTPLRLTASCVLPLGSLPLQRAEDKKATVIKQPVYRFRQSSAIRRDLP